MHDTEGKICALGLRPSSHAKLMSEFGCFLALFDIVA